MASPPTSDMASVDPTPLPLASDLRDRIADALRGLRFGAVEIQVHDGRVVRITRSEKILLEAPLARSK
jgi:hypothetical protein